MIHNFENTESWEEKTGNTYKLGNSKLASPHFFIFAAHFSAFTGNSFTFTLFEKILSSWYPNFLVVGILMSWQSIKV